MNRQQQVEVTLVMCVDSTPLPVCKCSASEQMGAGLAGVGGGGRGWAGGGGRGWEA